MFAKKSIIEKKYIFFLMLQTYRHFWSLGAGPHVLSLNDLDTFDMFACVSFIFNVYYFWMETNAAKG